MNDVYDGVKPNNNIALNQVNKLDFNENKRRWRNINKRKAKHIYDERFLSATLCPHTNSILMYRNCSAKRRSERKLRKSLCYILHSRFLFHYGTVSPPLPHPSTQWVAAKQQSINKNYCCFISSKWINATKKLSILLEIYDEKKIP